MAQRCGQTGDAPVNVIGYNFSTTTTVLQNCFAYRTDHRLPLDDLDLSGQTDY